jgi:hypothetical protein
MYQEMIQLARASYQNMIRADVGVRKTKPGGHSGTLAIIVYDSNIQHA